ncbi:hypothetical protein BAU15_09140 [Enterococcus sp. JM4C]|uniref:hypothetical protein n=1 Tax=Candidatus Enterococcus huntleyi TaxID=1857217 RepID=UPI0013798E4D|nr:hypothetical protein [Enterococcus sp. JM4C]KAF1296800.1 hypothetical protein BAU15_09140 [Enterococcus sp. JM4C]
MDVGVKNQVELFLMSFRNFFDEGRIKYEFNRKTSLFFTEMGWSKVKAAKYIRENINIVDYCEGPNPHHFKPNTTVTIFGVELDNREIYVKISIDDNDCGCMSFHPCERPLNYPLKGVS